MKWKFRKFWKSGRRLRLLERNMIEQANKAEDLLFELHNNLEFYSEDELQMHRANIISGLHFFDRWHQEYISSFLFWSYSDSHPDAARYFDRAHEIWGRIDGEIEKRTAHYWGDENEEDEYGLF